jgi:hypothetical protein
MGADDHWKEEGFGRESPLYRLFTDLTGIGRRKSGGEGVSSVPELQCYSSALKKRSVTGRYQVKPGETALAELQVATG